MRMPHQVRDAMTFLPDTLQGDATVFDGLRLMRLNRYRHLPVVVRGRPVGLVSDGDLKWALSLGLPESTPLSEIMTEEPYCVGPGDDLLEVLPPLLERRIGSAVVIDRAGEIAGILTTTDLLRVLCGILERDAGLDDAPGAAEEGAGAVRASGRR